jgi:hypothetical protein
MSEGTYVLLEDAEVDSSFPFSLLATSVWEQCNPQSNQCFSAVMSAAPREVECGRGKSSGGESRPLDFSQRGSL